MIAKIIKNKSILSTICEITPIFAFDENEIRNFKVYMSAFTNK